MLALLEEAVETELNLFLTTGLLKLCLLACRWIIFGYKFILI